MTLPSEDNDDVSLHSASTGNWLWVLIFVAALLIRSYGLTTQCLSNDEIIDLEIAQQTWTEVAFEADGFPPLHHLFLKAILQVTDNDLAGRWLSIVYGVLAIPCVGLLAQRIGGRRCGFVAAGLLAIAPMHVYFSQEGRAYALFFLVTALATWLFWRALQVGSAWSWATFAVGASLGGYAHYYFLFVLIAFGLIWIKHAATTGKWRAGLAAFVGVGVLSVPILALVGADIGCQQAMRQGNFSLAAVGYTGWSLLAGFCIGPSLRELHSIGAIEAVRTIFVWLVPVGGIVVGLFVSLLNRKHPSRFELLSLFLLPITFAFLVESCFSLSNFNVRYVIPSLLPLVVLLAIALTQTLNRKVAMVLAAAFVAVSAMSNFNRHQYAKYQNVDAKSACEFLATETNNPERVYTLAHYMQVAARHYLPEGYEVVPLEDVTRADGNLRETIALINQAGEPFWIFYSREFHGDPDGIFKQVMRDDPRVEYKGAWAGVELYRGEVPISAPTEPLIP